MLIAIFAPLGAHALEIAGPRDVFDEAARQAPGRVAYETRLIAEGPEPIPCASGLRVLPDRIIAEADEPVDTLMVVGPREIPTDPPPPATIAWLKQHASSARRFGSICTGAFLLGAAGLLDGRRVTTHWAHASQLAAEFPSAIVEPDRIFVRDGPLFTSAGVTAGMDLALALVEEDCGRTVALAVARQLVMFLKRPRGQSQFSVHLAMQMGRRPQVQQVQEWILENPRADLAVEILARRVAMSARNFSRVFQRDAGTTPADFVEAARVDFARRELEDTDLQIQRIAADCGFSGSAALRRAFLRQIGVTPLDYRARFRSTGSVAAPRAPRERSPAQ